MEGRGWGWALGGTDPVGTPARVCERRTRWGPFLSGFSISARVGAWPMRHCRTSAPWPNCQRGTSMPAQGLSSHSARASVREPRAAGAQPQGRARHGSGGGGQNGGRSRAESHPRPGSDLGAAPARVPRSQPAPVPAQSPTATAGPQLPLGPSAARGCGAGPPRSRPRYPRVPPGPVPLRAAVRDPRCGARSAPSPAAPGQPLPSPSPRGAAPRAHPGGPVRVALHLGEDEVSGLEAVRHGGRGAGRRRRPRPRAAASNGAGTARPGPQDVPPLPQARFLLAVSSAAPPPRPMGRSEDTAG